MTAADAMEVWSDALTGDAGADQARNWGAPKRIGELLPVVLAQLGLDDEELRQQGFSEGILEEGPIGPRASLLL
jgi:hypothetical protein